MVFCLPTEREPCWNLCVSEETPLDEATWILLIRAIGSLAFILYQPRGLLAIGLLSSFSKVEPEISGGEFGSLGRFVGGWLDVEEREDVESCDAVRNADADVDPIAARACGILGTLDSTCVGLPPERK